MKHGLILRTAAILLSGAVCTAALPCSAFAAATEPLETRLRNAWANMTTTVSVKDYDLTLDEFTEIYYETLYSDANWFYVGTSFSYPTSEANSKLTRITINYNDTAKNVAKKQEALDAEIQRIVDGIYPDWTDAEKVLYFHDHLAQCCTYDFSFKNYDAYSALLGGEAVCQGYALAMCLLCREVGIPCYALATDELKHMWNVVYLDGNWYHVDATNDDAVPNMLGVSAHIYLLRSDEYMQSDVNHAASDWYVFGYDGALSCDDDSYNNAFWINALDAATVMPDGSFLMTIRTDPNKVSSVSQIKGTLTKCRLGQTPETLLTNNIYWEAPDGGIFLNCYSVADIWGDRIYFTTPTEIKSAALDGSDVQSFHVLGQTETAAGSIFGMEISADGVMTYQLMESPTFTDESTYTFDAEYRTAQMPELSSESDTETTTTTTETTTSETETTTTTTETATTTTETTTTATTTTTSETTTTTTTAATESETTVSETASTEESASTTTSSETSESTDTTTSATSESSTSSTSRTRRSSTTTETTATETTTASSASTSESTTETEASSETTETTVSAATESEESSTTETTAAVSTVKGDLDLNGLPELADAVMLAKAIAGSDITLSAASKHNADCVADGTLDQQDLKWLLRMLAGFEMD